MEEQEQTSRDEILVGLKKHMLELRQLGVEISTIEKALDQKNRELHKLTGSVLDKQARISLSREERRELSNLATSYDATRNTDYGIWLEVLSQLKTVEVEDATCFFDHPQNLQVTISYSDRPSVTIDLVDSVRKDPNNIGHPLVVMALRRYAKLTSTPSRSASRQKKPVEGLERMKPEVAKNNIDRIFKALIASVGANQPIPLEETYISVIAFVRKFPEDYFETLWTILQESSVKNALRVGTKIERIKRKLLDRYPDFDHEPTISYLQSAFADGSKVKLPKRGGGDALRNAIVGWKYAVEPKTAKEYISKGQRWISDLASKANPTPNSENSNGLSKKALFSDEEIDEMSKEAMLRLLGMADIRAYEDISRLVKVEYPLPPKAG